MSSLPTRILAGITVPDTPTILRAITFARTNNDTHTFNHVMRSWLVGAATLSRLPSSCNIDQEAFAIAAILHDLGWSENMELISPDKRFEVDGANAARQFLLAEKSLAKMEVWTDERVQLVWDAIALHTTPDIALHSSLFIGIMSANVMTEIFGPKVTIPMLGSSRIAVTQQEWEEISKVFPREGLKMHLQETLTGLCRRKPEGTYGNFVGDFGDKFLAKEDYSQVGHRVVDLIEREMRG